MHIDSANPTAPGAGRNKPNASSRNLIGFNRSHSESAVSESMAPVENIDFCCRASRSREEEDLVLAVVKTYMEERLMLGHEDGPDKVLLSKLDKIYVKFHERIV